MKKRIVIAEDDADFSCAMSVYFVHKGYDILALNSVDQIVRYIESEPDRAQVFILDRQLKDGISEAVFDRISHLPASRFLILTAYPTFESSVLALRKKAGDYLVKPVALNVIENKVSSMFDELNRSKSESALPDQRWDALIRSHFTRSEITLIAMHRCIEIGIIPSTTNIATMLNLSIPTVHRGAKDLLSFGFVNCETDVHDRRIKIYNPTIKGKDQIDHLIRRIRKGIK